MATRKSKILMWALSWVQNDPDLHSDRDELERLLESRMLAGFLRSYYKGDADRKRIVTLLIEGYERWQGSRFESQVWHYTMKPDPDDPEIFIPDQPLHQYDHMQVECPVCLKESGTELVHVYDQNGLLVARGDMWGVDNSFTGTDATQEELIEIESIIEGVLK